MPHFIDHSTDNFPVWIIPFSMLFNISVLIFLLGCLLLFLFPPPARADSRKPIAYDAASSTLEIDLDTFAPECKDQAVFVSISYNRTDMRVLCGKSIFDLPVFGGEHIKLTYSRHPEPSPPPSP